MNESIKDQLREALPQIRFDEPLSRYCTIRIGGPAAAFIVTRTTEELISIITLVKELDIPFFCLGGGSNLLFADKGFDGLVIKHMANQLTISGEAETIPEMDWQMPTAEIRHEAADPKKYINFSDLNYEERAGDTIITADSGINLTALIVKTLDAGLTGLQWFGGIPGVIGGAIYNNIHGGTHFIGDRLVRVRVLDEHNEILTIEKEKLELGYDKSRFHHTKEVILTADFLLTKATAPEIERAEYAYREWTKRKGQMQPNLGSMGSTFQNISQEERERIGAPTTAAGWLIDQCRLKGRIVGQAQIAPEHANFIVNLGGATAADVRALMKLAQTEVKKKFGVTLKPEVFMVGFESD